MVIRRLVVAVGVFAALVGISQLAFASWWVNVVPEIVNTRWMAASGIVTILFGALMLIAVAEKLVGLRALFVVLGVYMLAVGAVLILNPDMTRDVIGAIMLNRSHSFQMFVIWVGGVLRIIIGALLILGAMRPPREPRTDTADESQAPL